MTQPIKWTDTTKIDNFILAGDGINMNPYWDNKTTITNQVDELRVTNTTICSRLCGEDSTAQKREKSQHKTSIQK